MIKAVIIDDQPENRDYLRTQLADYTDRIELTGEAGSVAAGIALIGYAKPGLIFLDVELGDGSGFDLLEAVPEFSGRVIFVTAFERYAVRAFRANAIDYLLKPVGTAELEEAIARVMHSRTEDEPLYRKALQNAALQRADQLPLQNIVISSLQGKEMIASSNISFIEADNTYSVVYLADGSKITASRPLLEFQEILDDQRFFRVHRSYLINVKHLKRFQARESCAQLVSGQTVPVSRRKAAAFSSFIRETFTAR
ncbi:two component transcriptional regulator, LytTR family [Cyclonatronum proteinivorum]|uniref:Two component transcriptional regulator, LytTR family n=1 Tax=Cyclonatronum proteinivorum TaxID=1457365 RepID=A0A345UP88_9BACT|nr:LytTR family DNA-binding domain-containing protein [Cyclonatronum proteinivorum]AXJ02290.1 two component transcriptional regulator, LytTR family [Cyclonatronum proteinivorum]